tara:strand:+ start:15456 stop:17306 length:1851 start_codon:yes stop_codon:yes gene_type:complete
MAKNKTEFSVYNLTEYNIPSIREDYGKEWVSFGDDNLYPQYLIELYTGSSIHSAVVKGVSSMIYGEGLDATDKDESPEKMESWLKLQTLLTSSPECLKRLAFDLKLHGMCYVNVIWNKPRTKVAQIKHIPAQYIRAGKCDHTGEIPYYYFSSDWSQPRRKEFKPYTIPAFNSNDRSQASQILAIKDYSPSSIFYSTPDYQGSTSYIQLDLEIAQFHLSNIKSGLFPSAMLNFNNGVPTAEERKVVERKIYEKFGGSGNAGKLLITFNDGTETKPEITPIQTNNADEQYNFLSQETTKKILTGHRVTSPLLFGVKGDGSGFGNNAEELRDSYSLFSSSVIAPFQSTLLSGLQKIFAVNEIHLDLFFITLKPADFLDLDIIDTISEEEQQKEGVEADLSKNETSIIVKDDNEKVCLDYFDEVGITLNKEEWFEGLTEQISSGKNLAKYHEFAYAPAGTPNKISEWSDIGMFRLLYRYSTNLSSNSRLFCQKMVAKSQAGTMYSLDDLFKASTKAVNKGFGPGGSNTYDIFLYKGGPNCKHYWERVWYFRRQVPKGVVFVDMDGKEYTEGEFLPNGTLNQFKEVSESFAYGEGVTPPVNDDKARTMPYWMPNHGYLNPR